MRLLSEVEVEPPPEVDDETRRDTLARAPEVSDREQRALQFWVKLSRAHNAIAAHAGADIARHGMTLAEFGILEALYHRGPLLLGEVQRRILVSSGGITFLVDRLTAKGLVERQQCPGDKRARYAALTPKGVRFVAEVFSSHAQVIAQAVSSLDDEELERGASLLRQVGLGAAAQAVGHPPEPVPTLSSSDQECEGA
jgi:MarR family 2-MHQ and catechol resistance regulon transcriptional repressor